MAIWITSFDQPVSGGRVRVAVKDAFDLAGEITTAGCAAVRDRAEPATSDARCLAGARSAAVIVGKTTLTELCVSPVGDNAVFGTPVNPSAPDRIPGGSSSGSAVAVATGAADIGFGTDTGGSVWIPAACCGIAGLKTTWGRVPVEGVWPLAPSLDTVGPLAGDVAGLAAGMRLLEPGWTVAEDPARRVGRLRIDGVDAATDDAVDAALRASGLDVLEVSLPGWEATYDPLEAIILAELWQSNGPLLGADGLGEFVSGGLQAGRLVPAARLAGARTAQATWRAEVAAVFQEVDVLALPTLVAPPPLLTGFAGFPLTRLTAPFNLAGVPALAMPIPSPGLPVPVPVPVSLQLVGPAGREDLLCTTALAIENGVGARLPGGRPRRRVA
ncbi:amidase [Paractinoplanes maris]|uniref:amidase n=1 Tax=Paractinoplanes maris TaxID=1734446 RepID=UPI00202198F2|nr:amidase [Actinoplanes maris]